MTLIIPALRDRARHIEKGSPGTWEIKTQRVSAQSHHQKSQFMTRLLRKDSGLDLFDKGPYYSRLCFVCASGRERAREGERPAQSTMVTVSFTGAADFPLYLRTEQDSVVRSKTHAQQDRFFLICLNVDKQRQLTFLHFENSVATDQSIAKRLKF